MRHFVIIAATSFLLSFNLINAQTVARNSYLSGTFNLTSYGGGYSVIRERAGYHYYLTNNLAFGGNLNTAIELNFGELRQVLSRSFSVGPSLKYHIPKVNWLFIEPAFLITINPDLGKINAHFWGSASLGLDIPLNKNVFLEIAFTDQFTTANKQWYKTYLFDIGFMVCLNRQKEKD